MNFDLYNITTIIYSAGFKCTENSVVINSIIDDGGGNKEKKIDRYLVNLIKTVLLTKCRVTATLK